MKHSPPLPLLAIAGVLVLAGPVHAQQLLITPGGSALNPPLPVPPPPPRIEVPPIPQMDAPPAPPSLRSSGRGSFGDRISRCLVEGAAAGLNIAERAAYSRACANRD
jgi:hypothetical protein